MNSRELYSLDAIPKRIRFSKDQPSSCPKYLVRKDDGVNVSDVSVAGPHGSRNHFRQTEALARTMSILMRQKTLFCLQKWRARKLCLTHVLSSIRLHIFSSKSEKRENKNFYYLVQDS